MSRKRQPLRTALIALAIACLSVALPAIQAGSMKQVNLTHLISDAQSIVHGTVKSVTDGIDEQGVPYTEVTLYVRSSAKGNVTDESEYTFRQFGLTQPRTLPDGRLVLAVTPEGFARWHEGETVVAFLRAPASMTGLQTTAGLAQGKLTQANGKLANVFGNEGLFEGVSINDELLNDEDRNLLTTPGPVDEEAFMSLVHRAVSEQWIENGEME